jgi:hypothetical protein
LTAAQRRFAKRRSAVAGRTSPLGGTFFYQRSPEMTTRWLVSEEGLVLQTVSFPAVEPSDPD